MSAISAVNSKIVNLKSGIMNKKENILRFFRNENITRGFSLTYPCKRKLENDNFVCETGTSYPASRSSNEGSYPCDAETIFHIIDLDGQALENVKLDRTVDGRTQVCLKITGHPGWFVKVLEDAAKTLRQQLGKSYMQRVMEFAKDKHPGEEPEKVFMEMKQVLKRYDWRPIR